MPDPKEMSFSEIMYELKELIGEHQSEDDVDYETYLLSLREQSKRERTEIAMDNNWRER